MMKDGVGGLKEPFGFADLGVETAGVDSCSKRASSRCNCSLIGSIQFL